MEEKRVRIADIAHDLGLSTATVSNVIHGKTRKISDQTVRRVQEDGFIAASLNALSREIDKAGYFMMVKTTADWNEIARFASMWNMEGLVIIGFCEQDYQNLREHMRIPFVIYDGFLEEGTGLVNLVIDHYDGGFQIGEYFKKLGHSKALCVADNDECMDHLRFEGIRASLPGVELLVVPMKIEEREAFYQKNLSYICQFSAIFAVSDYYAVEMMRFLAAQGIAVPEQISVAGFDDSMLSRQCHPLLTTIGQDHQERARLSIELLQKLRKKEKTELCYVLPVKLIVRESTGHKQEDH